MSARPYIVPAAAHHALNTAALYTGPRVVITEQLQPDQWTAVKNTLERAGAVYVAGASAFEFEPDQDAGAIVSDFLADGQVMSAVGSHGFVSTPADLADAIVSEHAFIGSTRGGTVLRVLEPSAGVGRFVDAMLYGGGEHNPERCKDIAEWMHITAIECEPRRARQIGENAAVSVVCDRFEDWARRAVAAGDRFDRVVMNPPFSVPGDGSIWARHLRLAWDLLAPGGRLVAIVPKSVTDPDAPARVVREAHALVAENGGWQLQEPDVFAESGITYRTAVVWLDRPLVDVAPRLLPAAHLPAWVFRPYDGTETPIPVQRVFLSRAAARLMPVQACADWSNTVRLIRYVGDCAGCGTPTWCNGYGDPRGDLGMSIVAPLNPGDNGASEDLPTVVRCFGCYDSERSRNRVSRIARDYWASLTAPPVPPAPEPAPEPYVSRWDLGTQVTLIDA